MDNHRQQLLARALDYNAREREILEWMASHGVTIENGEFKNPRDYHTGWSPLWKSPALSDAARKFLGGAQIVNLCVRVANVCHAYQTDITLYPKMIQMKSGNPFGEPVNIWDYDVKIAVESSERI